MATRKTVRTNLATTLAAAAFADTGKKCFTTVFENVPAEVLNDELPTCFIRLQDDEEQLKTDPIGAGLREQVFKVALHIFLWVEPIDAASGDAILDDILDAIATSLRLSTTDAGAVAIQYTHARTQKHDPAPAPAGADEPGMLLFSATRTFDAIDYLVG